MTSCTCLAAASSLMCTIYPPLETWNTKVAAIRSLRSVPPLTPLGVVPQECQPAVEVARSVGEVARSVAMAPQSPVVGESPDR